MKAPMSGVRRVAILCGVGTAIGLSGIILGAGSVGDPPRPATANGRAKSGNSDSLEIHTAAKMSFDISTIANGELEARNQINVRCELEGESSIVDIVAEGTQVKKGDLLVKLNSDETQERYDQEQLEHETAGAELVAAQEALAIQISENESLLRQAKLKLELSKLDLDQWRKGDVELKRKELDDTLDRTTKDRDRQKDYVSKSQSLFDAGFYSLDQLKKDQLDLERLEAELAKAVLAKQIYWDYEYKKDERTKVSAVEEAEAEVTRVESQNKSQQASKEAEKNNRARLLELRKQQLEKLEGQLAASTIVAPADGLVVYSSSMERNRWGGESDGPLKVGSKVWQNQDLIALPDTSEMVASVRVHESLAGRIRPGQPATIKVDAAAGMTFHGTVEKIGVLAEATGWRDPNRREYRVRVLLDEPAPGLKPSMRCEAEVVLGRVDEAIAVPVQAIFNEGALRFVCIPEGGKFARRPVRVGRISDRFAEVIAGLTEGEKVLLREPVAGEVINREFSTQELAAAGLERDDSGQIVPAQGQERGPRGGGRGASGPAKGTKSIATSGSGAAGAAEPESAEHASDQTSATAPETPAAHQDHN